MSRRYVRYSDFALQQAVEACKNWGQVCRKLSVDGSTGMRTHFRRRCLKAGIDFSHFERSWNRGKKFPKVDITYYLKLDGPFITTDRLKKSLLSCGLKEPVCEQCGLSEWLGGPVPIDLDHSNGNNRDNRPFNLKILCPNCHAVKTRRRRVLGVDQIASVAQLSEPGASDAVVAGGSPAGSTNGHLAK